MKLSHLLFTLSIFLLPTSFVSAASLNLSPNTGVYNLNGTFTTKVAVNTEGKPINAAEGVAKFNPQELAVVSIDKSASIFNLWVTEPTFSNSAGTITFSGGLPSGYTGASGNVFNITFRTKLAGVSRISFTSGAILANDGRGTNVLTAMNGGSYTTQALATQPVPEVIEYIAPANTPATPKIASDSRGEYDTWSSQKNAKLTWQLPSGVIAVRTQLDKSASTVPTKVYETPISFIELEDLSEGEMYLHLQFKNDEGWGKILHYRLRTDSEKPTKIDIQLAEGSDLSTPVQTLVVSTEDFTSGVNKYKVKINNAEPYEYLDEKGDGFIKLENLSPGYHAIIIEAVDKAGNSIIGTFDFTVEAFDQPVFTDYPNEINEEVIPVIRGLTRPGATVKIELMKIGSDATYYNVTADDSGVFTFIPEATFRQGVYEVSAVATDKFGAISQKSPIIRIAVQQPGYIQFGNRLVSVLSVVVPLVAMTGLLIIGFWILVLHFKRFRKKVSLESKEALDIVVREFKFLHTEIDRNKKLLADSKKTGKLLKAEEDAFASLSSSLEDSRKRVEKEIRDVEELVHVNPNK